MSETATALRQQLANSALRAAMDRLFYKLRGWVRVIPMREGDELPAFDVGWETGFTDGPEHTIMHAIKTNPALWMHAIPDECCIVPRRQLERLLGKDAAEFLAGHGVAMAETQANRLRYEAEDIERRSRQ